MENPFFKNETRGVNKKEDRQAKLVKEGYKPIYACIIDSSGDDIDHNTAKKIEDIYYHAKSIDYHADENFLNENNFKNAGGGTYVISENDESDKFSMGYCNCTGIVAVGEKKESKKQISFLSHQDPRKFLKKNKDEFEKDLTRAIADLKTKAKDDSIDVLIFGGQSGRLDEYQNSIKAIEEVLKKEFGFEPTVITGPNAGIEKGSTQIFLDTQNRQLYVVRPPQNSKMNESFLASDLEKQKEAWKDK